MKPVLQLALDHQNLSQALKVAREAVAGGIDWLEAGTPLIKSEGLDAVRALKGEFPSTTIVADMKVIDAGRLETECAAKAGANVVHVLGAASDSTIKECVEAARRYDARITVDLLGLPNREAMVKRAKEVELMGASFVCIHTPIDMQMRGKLPFEDLKAVASAVKIPLAVAGGINSETVVDAIETGGTIIIVGGAITKSPDAKKAPRQRFSNAAAKRKLRIFWQRPLPPMLPRHCITQVRCRVSGRWLTASRWLVGL
jgi:3-hexulose-6-phosphate synthase/6-phospho-3-hexuloisomerase